VALFFAVAWLEIVRQLRPAWSFDPQYGYGWSVPFLALFLIWKRWPDRPTALAPRMTWPAVVGIGLSAAILAAIRFIGEANPDWRLLGWAGGLSAMLASLCLVYLSGGRPWLRYFAFPFLFFLVAVPWPTQFEQAVIQNLMRIVTAINVALLNLAGIPALRHGNVVEVGAGLIGIEEACSGVRSLQATLMISLFLGDLYSFQRGRRIFLVVCGAGLAFVCNVVRTAILVWVGAHRGASAIEKWHDPAGLTILLVCLFGLWLVSLVMQRHSASHKNDEAQRPGSTSLPAMSSAFVRAAITCAALMLLFAEAGVQWWYSQHATAVANSRWNLQWPQTENDYKTIPIAPEAEGLLHYSDGGGAAWQATDGHPWMMYFFRWQPGRTAARFVKIHRPDICLPASGMTMLKDNGIRLLQVNGAGLPVRSYRFDDHGKALHVFYCYWDARSSYENASAAAEEDWTARGRVRAALRGRRELGAQMLELVVWGYEQDDQADAALRAELSRLIEPG
jgi:exosortase